jgi:hypothetical protein
VKSIDKLPDELLLAIFEFCDVRDGIKYKLDEAWQALVHVCRRWRSIVFGSPRRLKLRLVYTPGKRDLLDIWPPLHLIIPDTNLTSDVDNIVPALKHRDRVDEIDLQNINDSSSLEKYLAVMQEPFPDLTDLVFQFTSDQEIAPLADSFLGGFAPRLRFFQLRAVPFPGLPKLLLSATHLVDLNLRGIPHSGYISPETMATTLSTLTRLESLILKFQCFRSRPDRASRRPPPPTRTVLLVLTDFCFKGASEYLDDLASQIDAPRLNNVTIEFFKQAVLDTPQFIQFISRTPAWEPLEKAQIIFSPDAAGVNLSSNRGAEVSVKFPYGDLDWQVSSLEQVFASCLPPLSTLTDLYIYDQLSKPEWQDNYENIHWSGLLLPFTAVEWIFLSEAIAPYIVPYIGLGPIVVLPILKHLFVYLEGQPSDDWDDVRRDYESFVDRSVAVYVWERDWSGLDGFLDFDD